MEKKIKSHSSCGYKCFIWEMQDSCKTSNDVRCGMETWAVEKAREKKLSIAT